ncbi:NUDIX domain-containing protein [Micromonospora saelicesensis]|uniref:NUDIX domain-containing protein n=1 Tax=Micromonospora saelicesensis TaxID=285676 RepID=UPI000DD74178|nr:NUDIX hydrolase [Micromonospora saelicesensis]
MTWTDPAIWYANLPSFYAAAAALITDPSGNILLVKPTYRDYWSFPGGYVDEGEYPHDACAREVREELGVTLAVGDLLVVDWAPSAEQRPRSLISFTFDCGNLPSLEGVALPRQELEEAAFFSPEAAAQHLADSVAPRVRAAINARSRRSPAYLAGGLFSPPSSDDSETRERSPRTS